VPIDTQTPASEGWWLRRLLERLADKRDRYNLLDVYYRGENGIPVHADKAVRDSYRRLMRLARTNFAELVVEAVRERMQPTGFRTGAAGDELGDSEAWRIWQANALDADSSLVTRASLSMSIGYVSVGPVDPDTGAPLILPEDPREVIVEHQAGRRRKPIAALKVFPDDVEGVDRAYLYLPGRVIYATRAHVTEQALNLDGWEWSGGQQYPTDLGDVVPVVAFPNRADLAGAPMAEFEPHLSVLDRINYTILNRLEIATLQAFRQRGIKGVPDTHPQTGEPIDYDDIFASDPGALWILPSTADIWESGQVDLNPLRQAIRDDVQDLAAVSRTPLFYLTPDAANGSAEGASLAREGLVFKTQDRIVQASESWEQVMSLAFRFAGDEERASRRDMEVIWSPPERFSLAERYDAASKATAAGVPWRTVMTDVLQFSPQQVDRMESERATDALLTPQPAVDAGP
jgi:hypothetical protein